MGEFFHNFIHFDTGKVKSKDVTNLIYMHSGTSS